MSKLDYLFNKTLEKAIYTREFEKFVFEKIKNNEFRYPLYLSFGQEYIASSIATFLFEKKKFKKKDLQLFIQHRGHSIYLSFGANLNKLILELKGNKNGCSQGMGGSASISSSEINLYGHDGMMGSNAPISVGACFANRLPTICFLGDAAAEEDYFIPSVGWAITKNLPILFVIEDNNYSILTKKETRRNWSIAKIASSMDIEAYDIDDNPKDIFLKLKNVFKKPLLLNINTNRFFWHAGAGIDDKNVKVRHETFKKNFSGKKILELETKYRNFIKKTWNS